MLTLQLKAHKYIYFVGIYISELWIIFNIILQFYFKIITNLYMNWFPEILSN